MPCMQYQILLISFIITFSLIVSGCLNNKNYTDSEDWYKDGIEQFKVNRYSDAIKSFHKALTIEPNNPEIWYSKGRALIRLCQYNDADFAFDKAISVGWASYRNWSGRGISLYRDEKRCDEAVIVLSKSIQLNPDESHSWYYKGLSLRCMSAGITPTYCWKPDISEINEAFDMAKILRYPS